VQQPTHGQACGRDVGRRMVNGAVEWESNGGRIAAESKSNRSCNHRLKQTLLGGGKTRLHICEPLRLRPCTDGAVDRGRPKAEARIFTRAT